MKIHVDPNAFFNGGRQNYSPQHDAALQLIEKHLKETKKELKELRNKPKDDKDKDKKKEEERKSSPLDIFLLITCLSFLAITGETWMIISYFTHIVEILHK